VNDQVSAQRLLLLLRSDVLRNQRTWLIASGTAALVALLVSSLGAIDGDVGGVGFYQVFFIAALFGFGTLATSESFVDLHGRATSTAFLMLPASALEKTLVRLVLTTVGLIVALLALTTVLSWVLEGINTATFGVSRGFFTPWDGVAWSMVPHYLAVQSLFFLGAAWFRKLHYIKTVGAAVLIWIGLVFSVAVIALLFRASSWDDGFRITNFETPLESLSMTAKIVYYFALPLFCWFVAWLRVTEAQVSHGI